MSKRDQFQRHVKPTGFIRTVMSIYIHKAPICIIGICIVIGMMFISPPTYLNDFLSKEVTHTSVSAFYEDKQLGQEVVVDKQIVSEIKVVKSEAAAPLAPVITVPVKEGYTLIEVPRENTITTEGGDFVSDEASFIEYTDTDEVSHNNTSEILIPVSIKNEAKDANDEFELSDQVQGLKNQLQESLREAEEFGDKERIEIARNELRIFDNTVSAEIDFRIVDEDGEKSGFWRSRREDGPKQFFLVVEAVHEGEAVNWAVRDFDSSKVISVAKFGLQVNEDVFRHFSDDKKKDGRIDTSKIGIKPVGNVLPIWNVKTNGETIAGF